MKDLHFFNGSLVVDSAKTKKLYQRQIKISDNCDCEDCSYYENHFIKQPFEIFRMLEKMGVDLGKNLTSEPTGVWCIRSNAGRLIFFEQVYRIVGTILNTNEIRYEKLQNHYAIESRFVPYPPEFVDVELKFNNMRDPD